MSKVPAFSDIGKSAKELLVGGKDGQFQYDKLITVQSKTADGLEFTLTNRVKDSKVEQAVAAAYKTDKFAVLGQINPAGKIITSLTLSNPIPNLTIGVSGAILDPATGKLIVDWSVPSLTAKAVVGLTSQPKVDVSISTGRQQYLVGASAQYDSATSSLTTWSLGAGYTAADYQAGLVLTDGETVKGVYAHKVDATQTVGGEVIKSLSKETTSFTLGYQKRLSAGALFKARLNNSGITSLLYQTDLQPKTTITHALQFDATNLNSAPKLGISLSVKP